MWLIDGLGARWLQHYGSGSALYRDQRATLTTVYPATTASAISTILTTLPPSQHAITGWFVYLREIGATATILPFQERSSRHSLASFGIDPERLFVKERLANRSPMTVHQVVPEWIIGTPFNTAHQGASTVHGYHSADQVVDLLDRITREESSSLVYLYWPRFDSICHEHGPESKLLLDHFEELDRLYISIAGILTDRGDELLVTADHGLIATDMHHSIDLADHPALRDLLLMAPTGEPRSAICHLRNGCEDRFLDYIDRHLGHCCSAVASDELIGQGWFGPPPYHPQLASRLGDYILQMKGAWTLGERLPSEKPFKQRGVHGGASPEEMLIPLITNSDQANPTNSLSAIFSSQG